MGHTRLTLYHDSLLRNEVHLVVGVPIAHALSSTLHDAHLIFRWHHRKKYHTRGRLFHDRFRHEAISEQDLLRIGGRVEQIPVRGGLVTHPADYPHSSYAHYAFGQTNSMLDPHAHYEALAATPYRRQEQYKRLTSPARFVPLRTVSWKSEPYGPARMKIS